MGQPSEYDYPNQMQQQMPVQKMWQEQGIPLKTHTEQPSDKWHKIIDTIGENFGYAWVFWGFSIGIVVILIVLFKKEIKRRLGDIIKTLNNFVNKE